MARNMYGATSADFTIASGGRVISGAVLTLWTARTGGTQITDLLDVDSVACTTVTSAADGSVVYYGPNNDKTVHWADSGQGSRIAIRPTDITGDPPVMSIGTVTTGAAAANLTGTSESPVLNLTLPTAGANGVNTAAIQDGAVTAAKLADQPGNLLTANQAGVTTDLTGFATGISDGDIARSTAETVLQSYSVALTTTGTTAEVSVNTAPGTIFDAGCPFTAHVQLKGTAGGKTYLIGWDWLDAGGSIVGNTSTTVTGTTNWQRVVHTAVAPSGASHVKMFVYTGNQVGETTYLAAWGFWAGAGGTWSLPGVPVPGQGSIYANGAVELPGGDYAPEGVVTANPGSTFLQTSGAATVTGMLSWRKATGTGNTGWVAEGALADTGWRAITSGFVTANWSGTLTLRRVGHLVEIITDDMTNSAGGLGERDIYNLPSGFRNSKPTTRAAFYRVGTAEWLQAYPTGAHQLTLLSSVTASSAYSGYMTYLTSDTWPSSLPGSAA